MKRLNQTESPIFVILCVLCFSKAILFYFYYICEQQRASVDNTYYNCHDKHKYNHIISSGLYADNKYTDNYSDGSFAVIYPIILLRTARTHRVIWLNSPDLFRNFLLYPPQDSSGVLWLPRNLKNFVAVFLKQNSHCHPEKGH